MTAGSPNLVIRADGDARIGTGHVMRCLALGQAWQDAGGGVVFLTAPGTEALESRLGREGFEIHHVRAAPGSAEDGAETVRMSDACGAEWMVVDGYHFGPDYLQAVKGGNHGLLVVDDKGQTGACAANLVLNQNLHADEGLYGDRRAETRLLLGLDHVMLRREFRRRIGHRPNVAEVARKILVTLGGADRGNHTGLVMRALELAQTPGLEATVVVGPSNPNKEPLKALASAMSYPISFAFDIENMADLMAGVDLAICTGGGHGLGARIHGRSRAGGDQRGCGAAVGGRSHEGGPLRAPGAVRAGRGGGGSQVC